MWRRNPAGDVSILSSRSLLEKERNRYYLVLVSRETGFPGEFVEGQGKSSLKGEGFNRPWQRNFRSRMKKQNKDLLIRMIGQEQS